MENVNDKPRASNFNSIDTSVMPSLMFSMHNAEIGSKLDQFGLNPYTKSKWAMMLLIGVVAGTVAWILFTTIAQGITFQISVVQSYLDDGNVGGAYGFVLGWCILFAFLACSFVLYFPPAGGSGVPEVIGYLNGVDIKEIISVRTFFVKLCSCIAANISCMPVGAEGPMVHLGAIVGGGISQGRSKSRGATLSSPFWSRFRLTDYRRDFTTAGVGAGVAAAYPAPLGGLLFSMVEVSSYWTPELGSQIFAACLISCLMLQILNSLKYNDFGSLERLSLVDKAQGVDAEYPMTLAIFPICIVIGFFNGIFSLLWTQVHWALFKFRAQYMNPKFPLRRMCDVVLFAVVYNSIVFWLSIYTECQPYGGNWTQLVKDHLFVGTCPEGQYNPVGSLLFDTIPYRMILCFSTNSTALFSLKSIFISFVVFHFGSMYATTTATCPGLVMPSLYNGALIGRFIGAVLNEFDLHPADEGVMSLIGGACFFSGMSRQTLAVTVITLEIGGDIAYLFPIMLGGLISKFIGDYACKSLYLLLVESKKIPFLDRTPNVEKAHCIRVRDVMTKYPITLPLCVPVKQIRSLLQHPENKHNAFPVIMPRKTREIQTEERFNLEKKFYAKKQDNKLDSDIVRLSVHVPEKQIQKENAVETEMVSLEPSTRSKSNSVTLMSNSLTLLNKRATGEASLVMTGERDAGDDELVFGGLITRTQLRIILKNPSCFLKRDIFAPQPADVAPENPKIIEFSSYLKQEDNLLYTKPKPGVEEYPLTDAELEMFIDLSPYINTSAVTVSDDTILWVAYTMFMSLFLRHLVVLNARGNVVGIITRHDFEPHNIESRAAPRLTMMSKEVVQFMNQISIKQA